ncbi:MAG: regulatory protein RecX [Elusimicrobiota bacterium]
MKEKSTNYHNAQKYAFWLLTRRNHSEKEIRDKLGKNYDNTTIDAVIEKLKTLKLIDDEKFAKEWTDYRLRHNKSKNFIMRELNRKGIPRETASEILNSLKINETELAYDTIKNKLPRYKKLEPLKAKSKIFQFLASKGFSYDTIENVIEKFTKEEEENADDSC